MLPMVTYVSPHVREMESVILLHIKLAVKFNLDKCFYQIGLY